MSFDNRNEEKENAHKLSIFRTHLQKIITQQNDVRIHFDKLLTEDESKKPDADVLFESKVHEYLEELDITDANIFTDIINLYRKLSPENYQQTKEFIEAIEREVQEIIKKVGYKKSNLFSDWARNLLYPLTIPLADSDNNPLPWINESDPLNSASNVAESTRNNLKVNEYPL